jgi:hypothetical protein
MNAPETFREQLDTVFHVDHESGPIPLRLAEVGDERVGGGIDRDEYAGRILAAVYATGLAHAAAGRVTLMTTYVSYLWGLADDIPLLQRP